jgi:hypothetical protein
MKRICCLLLIVWGLAACGGGSGDSGSTDGPAMRSLQQDETVSGTIAKVGEVDWYDFNAVEANRTLTVSCTSAYTNSPVDFMLTVYEKDANGNMVTVFGKSAPEKAYAAADLNINVRIQQPKHLYFAVRDFKDDNASDQIQYRIKVSYSDETTQNSTFADAVDLNVGAAKVCHTDTIFPVGDVDCYRFSIAAAGVYRISAQFDVSENTPMPVNLGLELYDESGQPVYKFKGQRPANNTYVILANLPVGSYYMVVDDQGRNDQSQYTYDLCIEPVAAGEVLQNDSQDNAESRTEGVDGYNLDGNLEYFQDEDWYVLTVPPPSGSTFQNLRISLHTAFATIPAELQGQTDPGSYRIEVRDSTGKLLVAHDQPVTATAPYTVEIAAGEAGPHYIMVKPVFSQQMLVALPYQLKVQVLPVDDPNESPDPIVLNPSGETRQGKIAWLGDKDDYTINVDTTTAPKVLEVYFDTTEPSAVNYTVDVMWGGVHHILRDTNGTDNGTDLGQHFKSSYYLRVPDAQTDPDGDLHTNVKLQVSDDQNNDGDNNVTYTLGVHVLSLPTDVPATPDESAKAGSAVYFDEPGENADTGATDVTMIEYDSHNQPKFKANTTLLRVNALDANHQWRSSWIKGFVDYDGDRDIFELNFDDITASDPVWYCDIKVRLFAMASDVEYSWALFRDGPADNGAPNNILLERTFWDDPDGQILQYDENAEGVVAYWADDNLAAQDYDQTIPSPDIQGSGEHLWLGHVWSSSKFYLSIQDFDITRLRNGDQTVPNQKPDNDWGNTNSSPGVRPYYFQVTVTYHPGCSYPDDTSSGCTQ